MELLLVIFLGIYLVFTLVVIAGFYGGGQSKLALKEFPDVVILIAARNEAENIGRCLNSLLNLEYPKEKIQIWVGNDGSTDQTREIVLSYALANPNIHLYDVKNQLGSAKAKGNVLAQLVAQTTATYIFITDADISVNPKWVKSLLPQLISVHVGIVGGTTLVDGNSFFHRFQGIDWNLGVGYLTGLDNLNIKSTAVGNNMAFTRKAYLATGGYENMPFSVTEDYQLCAAIRAKGFNSVNIHSPESLNISEAQPTLIQLLHQRKRWMIGARDLPWFWLFIFGLQGLFFPCILALAFLNPYLALKIWLIKWFIQTLFNLLLIIKLKRPIPVLPLVLHELLNHLLTSILIVFYFLPKKMVWKERAY